MCEENGRTRKTAKTKTGERKSGGKLVCEIIDAVASYLLSAVANRHHRRHEYPERHRDTHRDRGRERERERERVYYIQHPVKRDCKRQEMETVLSQLLFIRRRRRPDYIAVGFRQGAHHCYWGIRHLLNRTAYFSANHKTETGSTKQTMQYNLTIFISLTQALTLYLQCLTVMSSNSNIDRKVCCFYFSCVSCFATFNIFRRGFCVNQKRKKG